MSIVHRAGDTWVRPVGSDRRVDRAGPMENACDTLRSHSIVVETGFPHREDEAADPHW